MTLEFIDFLQLADIEYLDLSHAVPHCDLIIVTERHRAEIVAHIGGLVQLAGVGRAARP